MLRLSATIAAITHCATEPSSYTVYMSLQHVAAKDRLRQQQENGQALKAAKLEAVDRLLWQTDFLQQQGSTQSPSGAPYTSRVTPAG